MSKLEIVYINRKSLHSIDFVIVCKFELIADTISGFRKDFVRMEKKYQIRLNATAEVQEFVSAAEKCDFDIDVFYNRVIIDAKSILGVLSLDLNKVLTVQFGGQSNDFENVLKKYVVA